jgi:hypothetical protein
VVSGAWARASSIGLDGYLHLRRVLVEAAFQQVGIECPIRKLPSWSVCHRSLSVNASAALLRLVRSALFSLFSWNRKPTSHGQRLLTKITGLPQLCQDISCFGAFSDRLKEQAITA